MPLRPAFHAAYSGLHLYEEAVLGFPLPLRERDRVRGKAVATHLLIQTKSAVSNKEATCVDFHHRATGVWQQEPLLQPLSNKEATCVDFHHRAAGVWQHEPQASL